MKIMRDNKILNPKIKTSNLGVLIIMLLMVVNIVVQKNTGVDPRIIYIIDIYAFLMLLGFFNKFGIFKNKYSFLFMSLFLYFLYIFLLSLSISDYHNMFSALHILALGVFMCLLMLMDWSFNKFMVVAYCLSFFTFLSLIHWLIDPKLSTFSSVFTNSNNFAIVMYVILFFHLLALVMSKNFHKSILFFIITLDIILIYFSTSRTSWLAIIVSLSCYKLYRYVTYNKTVHRIVFFIVLLFVYAVTYIYPKLYTTETGWKLNEFIQVYTGKSLFTGRQTLWIELISIIENKPLFGYGLDSRLSDFMSTNLTSHNTYLGILLHSGTIGLMLYLFFLFIIWELLYQDKTQTMMNQKIARIISAYFIGLMFYQIFEMLLLKEAVPIAAFQLSFFAIGLGILNTNRTNSKTVQ